MNKPTTHRQRPLISLYLVLSILLKCSGSSPTGHLNIAWTYNIPGTVAFRWCAFNPQNPSSSQYFMVVCLINNISNTQGTATVHTTNKLTGEHFHQDSTQYNIWSLFSIDHPKVDYMFSSKDSKVHLRKTKNLSVFNPNLSDSLKYRGVYSLTGHPVWVKKVIQIGPDHFLTFTKETNKRRLYFWEIYHANLEASLKNTEPSTIAINPVLNVNMGSEKTGFSYDLINDVYKVGDTSLLMVLELTATEFKACRFNHDFMAIGDKSLTAFTKVACMASEYNKNGKTRFSQSSVDPTVLIIAQSDVSKILFWDSNLDVLTSITVGVKTLNSKLASAYYANFFQGESSLIIANSNLHGGILYIDPLTGNTIGYVSDDLIYKRATEMIQDPISKRIVLFAKNSGKTMNKYTLLELKSTGCHSSCSFCTNNLDDFDPLSCAKCADPNDTASYNSLVDPNTVKALCGCHPTCSTCDGKSINDCLVCSAGHSMSAESLCVCGPGEIENESFICEECDPSCLECSGTSSSECTACLPIYELVLGSCVLPNSLVIHRFTQTQELQAGEATINLELSLFTKTQEI